MKIISVFTIGLILFFTSCSDAIYENSIDLKEEVWKADTSFNFQFNIEKVNTPHQFSYVIRNSLDYPYHNLFIQYFIENEEGRILKKDIQEVFLMEKKTGRPYGKGFGGIYQNKFSFAEPIYFAQPGKYKLRLEHYMRGEKVSGIVSLGLEIKELK